ncbi:PQQ-binding-like beta-propeller repeat protein [Streptomyces sp. NPDC005574]|uniref:outer membrane protein assembly factor BamB family protein n=1 Tax=Streptomyces sp. NPDC005574 TaxID=3156891 RepID=UPI00339F1CC1
MLLAGLGGTWTLWGTDRGAGTDSRPPAAGGRPAGVRQDPVEETAPREIHGRALFTVAAPRFSRGDGSWLDGQWVTRNAYVHTGLSRIDAYSLGERQGRRLWSVPLGGPVCSAGPQVSDHGRVAVVLRARASKNPVCDQLAVVDIDNGRKLWQATLPTIRAQENQPPSVAINGGVVAVGAQHGLVAYPLEGTKPLWRSERLSCGGAVAYGGQALVVRILDSGVLACGRRGERLQKLDPLTGNPVWTYRLPDADTYKVLSNNPVVVATSPVNEYDDGDDELTHVISLDDDGKRQASFELGEASFAPCFNHNPQDCSFVVSDDTLYLPTTRRSQHQPNSILAFDLENGRTRAEYLAQYDHQIVPLRMSGERLIALQAEWTSLRCHCFATSTARETVEVLGIEPAGGKKTVLLRASFTDPDVKDTLAHAETLFRNGRLFLGRNRVDGPQRDRSRGADQLLGAVFGVRPR